MTSILLDLDDKGFILDHSLVDGGYEPLGGSVIVEVISTEVVGNFLRPKLKEQTIVEGASKKAVQESYKSESGKLRVRLEHLKRVRIFEIKKIAGKLIDLVLPLYKQVNLVRRGELEDPRFSLVDEIIEITHKLEKDISAIKKIDRVCDLSVLDLFKERDELFGKNGPLISYKDNHFSSL
jgi:hypothetical protein